MAAELAKSRAEVERLRAEVEYLRKRMAEPRAADLAAVSLGHSPDSRAPASMRRKDIGLIQYAHPEEPFSTPAGTLTAASSPDEKIALYLSLFRGREDVYAMRWEGRNGRSGYSPACANEWRAQLCGKPQILGLCHGLAPFRIRRAKDGSA